LDHKGSEPIENEVYFGKFAHIDST